MWDARRSPESNFIANFYIRKENLYNLSLEIEKEKQNKSKEEEIK